MRLELSFGRRRIDKPEGQAGARSANPAQACLRYIEKDWIVLEKFDDYASFFLYHVGGVGAYQGEEGEGADYADEGNQAGMSEDGCSHGGASRSEATENGNFSSFLIHGAAQGGENDSS